MKAALYKHHGHLHTVLTLLVNTSDLLSDRDSMPSPILNINPEELSLDF